jgi:hypothetical protein
MIISVQSLTNIDARLTTFAANRISGGPTDERLLTMAGNVTRAAEMIITRFRPARRDRSVAMRQNLWIALDPDLDSSAFMPP